MKRLVAPAAALLLVTCAALDARAQVATATVEVRPAVAGGHPATGASVRLESEAQTVAWDATVADRESVVFRIVPPGRYRLSVSLGGFAPASLVVSVAPGEFLSCDAVLEPDGGTTEHASHVRLADRHETAHGTAFGDAELRMLPQSGRVWGLLERSDGLTISDRMDNGGISGDPARVARSGASWTETTFRLGQVDITDPLHLGMPLLYPDLQAFEAVEVGTATRPAEEANGGTSIAFVPRRPAPAWERSIEFLASPRAFQSTNDLPGVPALDRLQSSGEGRLLLSGPLSQRAGLFLSASYGAAIHTMRASTEELDNRAGSLFAHLVFTPDAQNEIRVVGAADRLSYPDEGRARLIDRALKAHDTFGHASVTWDHRAATGTAWSLAAGYQRGGYRPADTSRDVTGTIERMYDGPVDALAALTGANRSRWNLDVRVEPDAREWVGGRHLVRFGGSADVAAATMDAAGAVTIGELVNGVPARAWSYATNPGSHWSSRTFAAFAADRFTIGPRVEAEIGLRAESTLGSRPDAHGVISWRSIDPRVALTWHADEGGRFTMRGGFGRYAHRLPLEYLAYGDPLALAGHVYRWNDRDGDRVFQLPEIGTLIAPIGPCCAGTLANGIDPDLKQPWTDEYFASMETRLGRTMVLRLTGTDHREYRLVQPVNVGVDAGDYTVSYVYDPALDLASTSDDQLLPVFNRKVSSFGRDRYVLTNPAADKAVDHGLDLTFARLFDGRWGMLIGATARKSVGNGGNRGFLASENDQGVLGEFYLDPNAATYGRGRLFFERGYILKWITTLGLPGRTRLGVSARYQDGQHFSRLVIATDLNQGAEMIQAQPRGATRFTFQLTLDARVEKALSMGRRSAWLIGEVYNLLNTANEVEEDVRTGSTFRTPTAVQPPRAIRVGLRVEF